MQVELRTERRIAISQRDMYRGKRLLDLVVAVLAMIILLPVFIFLAIGIKLTSPGPVLYKQKRVGMGGYLFEIYKFRTMVQNADHHMPLLYAKIPNDNRITGFGKVLRKLSLDELPQLINIVKGEMSLVGPRPFIEVETEKLTDFQRGRLAVLPGITGLAQIKGRSDLPIDKLVRFDIDYVNRCSFTVDVSILLRTIPYVLFGKGAY